MSIPPAERVEILKQENRLLEGYARTLSHEQLMRQSPCAAWTVADVIAHITEFNFEYAGYIIKALGPAEKRTAPLPSKTNARVDASVPAQRVVEYRKRLGDDLLAQYAESNRVIADAFEHVGPDDWQKLCYRKSGAETLASVLDVFIVDVGIHRWDVMSPFDPDVRLTSAAFPVMVERYPHRPRWWDIPLPATHPPLPARFRFEVTDTPATGTDFVISTDGEQFTEVAGSASATVVFQCDAQTFLLVGYGRVTPEAAVASGQLTYAGQQDWADLFLTCFVGG